MVRPLKEINWDIVEKRMEAGCSGIEIAASLHVDADTFYNRFKLEYGKSFQDYSAKFYSVGDANLKFTQYMKAINGNIPMLQLLGKERLGQGKTDNQSNNIISEHHLETLTILNQNPDLVKIARDPEIMKFIREKYNVGNAPSS